MNSNTHFSELQAGIRHYWPETHIVYTEGLIKGSGTFHTSCRALTLPIPQVSRSQPRKEMLLPVRVVLRAATVAFQSPSSTPGFLSQQLTDDFCRGCSHTRDGSHSSTAGHDLV